MTDPIRLARKNILSLRPYSTARDEYSGPIGTWLDANESPFDNGYNRYPDPHQRVLKGRISEMRGIPAANIFVGNGSDEAIDLLIRTFCEPGTDNVVSIAPTYGMYRVAADVNGVEFREAPLGAGFALDTGAVMQQCDAHTKLIFLCSPNNPTGNSLERSEIMKLITGSGCVVVLDEAYIDFSAGNSFLAELNKYPNLVILQTLSKAWGMAGLRLGLAFGHGDVIALLSRVKYPYNINCLTQRLACQLLDRNIETGVALIVAERERVARALGAMKTVRKVWPGDANFLLVAVRDPEEAYRRLIAERIIVRDRSRVAGCEGCLRITIGTPEENDRLIATMEQLSR